MSISGIFRESIRASAAIILSWLFSVPAHADELYSVVSKAFHFDRRESSLVITLQSPLSVARNARDVSRLSGRFLVISGSNIYVAVDEQTDTSTYAIIERDYNRWPDKKLIRIGGHLYRDYCVRWCPNGYPEDPITLKFGVTAVDPALVADETLVVKTN